VLGQPELGLGALPGAGGMQHLARLLGRGRALEVILTSQDVDADLAERYGWINCALPDADLDELVATVAARIASFPVDAIRTIKQVVNEVCLPRADAVRADAARFQTLVRSGEVQDRTRRLFAEGFQTRGDVELDLGVRLADLSRR